jgi:hypothetical protein
MQTNWSSVKLLSITTYITANIQLNAVNRSTFKMPSVRMYTAKRVSDSHQLGRRKRHQRQIRQAALHDVARNVQEDGVHLVGLGEQVLDVVVTPQTCHAANRVTVEQSLNSLAVVPSASRM